MATTPKTVKTYDLDGTKKDFTIPFEYLARKFVVVTLVGTDRRTLALGTDYRFSSATQITTLRGSAWGPGDGYEMIEIRRFTSATERLVDFVDGSILRAYDLNIAQVQSLHIAEEARDLTADTIAINNDGNLDARGKRIVNLADGVDPGDAVTMRQQAAWAGSALDSADKAKASELAAAISAANALTSEGAAAASAQELEDLYGSVVRVPGGHLDPLTGDRAGRVFGFDDQGQPKAYVLDAGSNTALSGTLNSPEGTAIIKHGRARLKDLLNDSVNIRQFGAIGDGTLHPASELGLTLPQLQAEFPHATSLTDSIDWLAMQQAMAVAKRRVLVPDGRFIMDRDVTRFGKDIRLEVDGIIDFGQGAGGMKIYGELVALPKVTGTLIAKTTRAFPFAAAHTLAKGDVFIMHNPTDKSWSDHRTYYNDGEYFQVHQIIDSSNLRIYGTPSSTYTASAFNVYKLNGPKVVIDGGVGKFLASATANKPAVWLQFCKDVELRGVNAVSGTYNAAYVDRCYNVRVAGGQCIDGSGPTGDNYGLLVGNSQEVYIEAGSHRATRHAIALGGTAGPGCVPYRNITIVGCNLANGDDTNAGAGASDMHGNGDHTTYIGCHIDSHANIAGRGGKYLDCTITGRKLEGIAAYGSEIVGGIYEFINCRFECSGDFSTWAVISLSMTTKLKEPLKLIIRNLNVIGTGSSALGKLVKVAPATGEDKAIDIVMTGIRADIGQMYCFLWLRSDQTPTQPLVNTTVTMEDVTGPSGAHYVGEAGVAALGPVKFRLPAQNVEGTVAVTVNASILSTAMLLYRHPYPQGRIPTASLHWRKPDTTSGMYVGNKIPVLGPYVVDVHRCQVTMMPSDKLTFTETSAGSGVMVPASVIMGATLSLREF